MGILKNGLLYLIYPPRCIFCRKILPKDACFSACADCSNEIEYCMSVPYCKVCGKPLKAGTEVNVCSKCRKQTNRWFEKIRSAFVYKDNARLVVIRYKSSGNTYYGAAFAAYLEAVVKNCYSKVKFDMVISVAPRRNRMRKQRFDQAEYLAKLLAKRLSIPFCRKVLYQKEERRKQSELGFAERWDNIKGNIGVKKKKEIKDKVILLVDDVCTTGATINESAAVLRREGAKAVYAVTVATV